MLHHVSDGAAYAMAIFGALLIGISAVRIFTNPASRELRRRHNQRRHPK